MADSATWHLVRPAQERPFLIGGDVIVGRSKEASLRISEGFVSRRHARLWLDGERLMVEDLGSANGTFVNGRRIAVRTCLEPGDRVCFDETEFHVEFHGQRTSADPNATVFRPDNDEGPEFRKPERPAAWAGASTQITDSDRASTPTGSSGTTRKRPTESEPHEIDFDLDLGAAPAEPEPVPAARPRRAATIDEPDFDLGLTGESAASSRPVAPSAAPAPAPAPVTAEPATAAERESFFDSLDLSLGNARLDSDEPAPIPSTPRGYATVIMGRDAPGFAGPTPAAAPGADAMGLLGLTGLVEGHLFSLADGRISIGRSPECDIMIEEGSVSKRHAELVIRPGSCRIHDLSRANGVFVNGNQAEDAALNPGDVIRLGRVEFMFDSYARLMEGGDAAETAPAWVWMVAGFVGAGALLAIGALFVL